MTRCGGRGSPPILQACRLRAGYKGASDLILHRAGNDLPPSHPSQELPPPCWGAVPSTHFLLLRGRCLAAQEDCWPSDTTYARSGFES